MTNTTDKAHEPTIVAGYCKLQNSIADGQFGSGGEVKTPF